MGKTLAAAQILGGGAPVAAPVVVITPTLPVLTLAGTPLVELEYGVPFAEPGFAASDNIDGDISNRVAVTGSVNPFTPGVYRLDYSITNAAGTVSTTRVVEVKAQAIQTMLPPTLTLQGFTNLTMEAGDEFAEMSYSAVDYFGTDITNKVIVKNNVNNAVPGTYTVEYNVEDAWGNAANATRTVTVVAAPVREVPPPNAPTAPVITIIGSDPIILHLEGTPYTEQGAIAHCDVDGNISANVVITGSVNTSAAGTYTVTYTITNSAGLSASATRTVRVLAPTEQRSPRGRHGFSGQGRQGETVIHRGIETWTAGWMDLTITEHANNTTITVMLVDTFSNQIVMTDTFTARGTKSYLIPEGTFELRVRFDRANGNTKYALNLLMPEEISFTFGELEVPLTDGRGLFGDSESGAAANNTIFLIIIIAQGVMILGAGTAIVMLAKKRKTANAA
jgi:hypothetical protein